LRERGFRKRRNRFRRADETGWEIVDFQASQWGSRDNVRFTINLQVGVPQRLGALIADGEDRWWSGDADTDVVQLTEELRTLLADHALPWLEERSSLEQLLDRRGPAVPRYLIWS
jgi:hypothetical protein